VQRSGNNLQVSRKWRLGLANCAFNIALGISSAIAFSGNCALAQVTSDGTLGTLVDPNLAITGGTTVGGTNLFHSFTSFSVPDGAVADFQNAPSIVNIFSRVTGGVQSDILGTIQAQGSANFFLLNPSGISFGPNAQLRIGGSFVGTTADGIRFPGDGEFSLTSAVAPNNQLLTVNPSALFFNQTPAGAITNQSTVGLDVDTGQNLFLVGGNVNFDGGVVLAPSGRIELGGLAEPGEVEIVEISGSNNPNLNFPDVRLSFPDDVARADVSLINDAGVSASITSTSGGSDGAGIVIVRGNNVSIDNSGIFSQILPGAQGSAGGILIEAGSLSLSNNSQIASSSFGTGTAGAILLNVDGSVSLTNDSVIFNNVENGATDSTGGLVIINAESLSLLNGSQIQTLVRGDENGEPAGQGDAGNITINVQDTVTISGLGNIIDNRRFPSAIFSSVGSGAVGNAGDIRITARSISLSNFGRIDTSISGMGEAGNIFLQATDSISLADNALIESAIEKGAVATAGSNAFAGNIFGVLNGRGGDISGTILIDTGTLSLTNNSLLNTSTFGEGNAGAIVVVARDEVLLSNRGIIFSIVGEDAQGTGGAILMGMGSLSINGTSDNPSGITTSTLGQGDAGLIFIGVDGNISITGDGSGISSSVGEGIEQAGGGIFIEANSLFLNDGAVISVDNEGSGEGGSIFITARQDIILRDKVDISAETASGEGGNILLIAGDFFLLLGNSDTSTTAGNQQFGGNGGNINVVAKFAIAAPPSDNNVRANAFTGRGGNIRFTVFRQFDIEERELLPSTNDINASSDFGIDGLVTTNVINVDPTSGFTNLPNNTIDPTTLIAETCPTRSSIAEREKNQFIITGQGGLPPDPNAAFPGEAVVNDWEAPSEEVEDSSEDSNAANPVPVATTVPQESNFIEAQGWIYGENGEVIFTAQASSVTPTTLVLRSSSTCNDN